MLHREVPAASGRTGKLFVGLVLTAIMLILSGYALTTTSVLPTTIHLTVGLAGLLLAWLMLTGRLFAAGTGWLSTAVATIFIVTALLGSLLHTSTSLAGALHVPALILCGFLIAQAVPFSVFINWFSVVMAVLALIAFGAWFLFIALELPLVGGEVTNFNGAVYSNGVVYFFLVGWDGAPIDRSMGPFWEPGLFASFLVLAIILEISYRRNTTRAWVIVSLILGIFIAQSTAGFLLVIPALALFLFKRRSAITRAIAFVISLLVVIAFSQLESIIRQLVALDSETFGKLETEALQSSSRANIFDLNLRIFGESPLIGWGFAGADQEVVSDMAGVGVAAQTSTSTYFLAALGVIGLLYTLGWFAILLDTNMSISERIIILTCILIILNKEPHSAILVTFVLFFYVLSRVDTSGRRRHALEQLARR